MLTNTKLNDALEKIMRGINNVKPVYLGVESLENIELGQSNGYISMRIADGNTNHTYQYLMKDADGAEEIIRGLINSIYKKDILPRKGEIKKLKKQLNRQLERVCRWQGKLYSMKKDSQVYDLEQREICMNKLAEINECVYFKYKRLDIIRKDLCLYKIFKNILFAAIKELLAA
jgi:predicted DNA-binding protein